MALGYYTEGELRYAGMVRAEFTNRSREVVLRRISVSSFKRQACPFVDLPHRALCAKHPFDRRMTAADMPAFRWLPLALVTEVSFVEWDRHGLLRDGRFLGIPEDK